MAEQDFRPDEAAVEKTDIHPRRVLAVAALILLTLLVAGVAIWALLPLWHVPATVGPNAPPVRPPQPPRLQAAPQNERAAYFAEKDRLLHSYEWLDRERGTARIPVEAAMDILAGKAGQRQRPAP